MVVAVRFRGSLRVRRLNKALPSQRYIYAMFDERTKLVKFGRTRFLEARRIGVADACRIPRDKLHIIGYHIDHEMQELFVHHALRQSRVCGEWFALTPEVRRVLRQWKRRMLWNKMTPTQRDRLIMDDTHVFYTRNYLTSVTE